MVEPVLKALISTTAGIATLGFVVMTKPVEAAVVTYDFTVDVTTGNYIGKYDGSFSYNDSQPLIACGVSSTGVPLSCASRTDHNLSILFNFLGQIFTQQDERDFAAGFPSAYFSETNNIVGLSLLVLQPKAPVGFFILGGDFLVGNVEGPNPYDGIKVGTVSYKQVPAPVQSPKPSPWPPASPPPPDPCEGGSCTAVPEPSEMIGSTLAVGLLALGWRIRRRIMGK